ncbi:MAG: hypothetical protein WKF36_07175 [Candidatus Nitrosocosmicus sp.]
MIAEVNAKTCYGFYREGLLTAEYIIQEQTIADFLSFSCKIA